jgi:hypothetical protein
MIDWNIHFPAMVPQKANENVMKSQRPSSHKRSQTLFLLAIYLFY